MTKTFIALAIALVAVIAVGAGAVFVWPYDYLTRSERLSALEVIVGGAGFFGAIIALYFAAHEFGMSQSGRSQVL